jgi:hypothetical protein
MKPTTLLFFVFLFLAAVKFFKVVFINNWILVGVFVLWFLAFYIQTHAENKRKNMPMPVYLSNPQ